MEFAILEDVRAAGIGTLESRYGSLEEYLADVWELSPCRSVSVADWLYTYV